MVTTNADITEAPALTLRGTLESLTYSMLFTENKKVSGVHLKDGGSGHDLRVQYGDFAMIAGKEVPQVINISSNAGRKQIAVDLKYNRIDIDTPVDMPFNVPKRFIVKN